MVTWHSDGDACGGVAALAAAAPLFRDPRRRPRLCRRYAHHLSWRSADVSYAPPSRSLIVFCFSAATAVAFGIGSDALGAASLSAPSAAAVI